MSIFGSIMSKIFRPSAAKAAPAPQRAPAPTAPDPAPAPAPSAPTQAQAAPQVDVEAVLDVMAKDNAQTLDWRRSIVDLMKLLSIDSSLAARKELAQELGYTGDMGDSAAMNIWLHKQVMRKLAENGGIVPDSLR